MIRLLVFVFAILAYSTIGLVAFSSYCTNWPGHGGFERPKCHRGAQEQGQCVIRLRDRLICSAAWLKVALSASSI